MRFVDKMRCKYCKTKISLATWLLWFGMCFYCNRKISEPETKKRWAELERQEEDSKKYWESKK